MTPGLPAADANTRSATPPQLRGIYAKAFQNKAPLGRALRRRLRGVASKLRAAMRLAIGAGLRSCKTLSRQDPNAMRPRGRGGGANTQGLTLFIAQRTPPTRTTTTAAISSNTPRKKSPCSGTGTSMK